jgi:hypothetical protein
MTDMKMVVSFADGASYYAKAMMRLEQSLRQVGFGGEFERFKGINDYSHIGSPFHKGSPDAVPYAFKAYSIKKAMEDGADLILWCDSVVYATKSIHPIFQYIKNNGYLFFNNIGYTIGDYTSDACLRQWGMSRKEAFESPMLMACVLGFDVHHWRAKEFLNKYIAAASDGFSYPGDWYNNNLQVSNDLRVKGHRHDQSVASILVKQMGLEVTNAQNTYFAYAEHKGKIPISQSVCLWSEGIS